MQINNVAMFNGDTVSISVEGDTIAAVSSQAPAHGGIDIGLAGVVVFPGLINSHDHLDFNIFPRLGNHTYRNYTEWGYSIHTEHREEIRRLLNIPLPLRTAWGMYKNLFCGITTVVNHGRRLALTDPVINIVQPKQNLHSVRFEKYWKWKLNNPFLKKQPCVIHAGEGTDEAAREEIDELLRWNLLKKNIIAVHGVAMNPAQAKKFEALVWCPASNYFLLNRTAAVDELKEHTQLCFGTDSTLTSTWNIWEHLRIARSSGLIYDADLFEALTSTPAQVWKLNTGAIAAGRDADLVIAQVPGGDFYSIDPRDILMVMQKGKVRLYDQRIANLAKPHATGVFTETSVNGYIKYVTGDWQGLINETKKYYRTWTSGQIQDLFY